LNDSDNGQRAAEPGLMQMQNEQGRLELAGNVINQKSDGRLGTFKPFE
jgi:hypothetical protein